MITAIPSDRPSPFWTRWLLLACVGVVAFGLVLVVVPSLARQGFSLLVYFDGQHIDAFGPDAARYIGLAHAVIGAVMMGWGLALAFIVVRLVSKGSRLGWNIVSASLVAWFVPDTLFSLLSGFWQNAALNASFAMLFAVPLLALRRAMRDDA